MLGFKKKKKSFHKGEKCPVKRTEDNAGKVT